MSRWLFGGFLILLAAALVLLGLVISLLMRNEDTRALLGLANSRDLSIFWEAPSFSLVDQLGRAVTAEGLRGKVLVGNFAFTSCTDACPPFLIPRMRGLQDRLREEGLLGQKVVLLSFSVDPEQDNPRALKAYAERSQADHDGWRFLTGPGEEMRRVVLDGFKLPFEKLPQTIDHVHADGSVHQHEYNVAHTNRAVLVDQDGQVRAFYDMVEEWDPARVLQDIRYLVAPSP